MRCGGGCTGHAQGFLGRTTLCSRVHEAQPWAGGSSQPRSPEALEGRRRPCLGGVWGGKAHCSWGLSV